MRALVFAVIALCLGATVPGAAAQTTSAASATPAQLVEHAEQAWAESLVSKDLRQLTGVLDRRFQLIMVGGGGVGYHRYLQDQSDPHRAYRRVTPTSISVSVNGDVAVAVVSMTVVWPEGIETHWQFTDTWTWAEGEWRAVIRVSQAVHLDTQAP